MANYMAEVAKILGVELGEEFEIKNRDGLMYRLTENGLILYGIKQRDMLLALLEGRYTIKEKPWRPKLNEQFWFVLQDGHTDICYCKNSWYDIALYKFGNCYRTREEAEANRDKWIAFYASDKVVGG